MEFKQLEAFVAVVDYKSFSEAAKHLYLTQPTISSHIQALEKELNSRLLIRTTKQMKVTDRGMQLYECAVHMLNMRNQITDEFVWNKWKLIDVSASTIPSSYLLPELLSEFSKIQPDIHFHIWQSDSADAIEKVIQGAVDFGLTGSKTDAEDCCFIPFCTDSLVMAAPVTPEYLELADTLKKEEPVALKHFLSHPFILRANGSGTRKEIDLFLERHQINLSDLNIVARMNDLESIKKSIVSGLGVSILSARSVKDMERTHQLLTFPLESAAQVRTFYIVYSKNRILKPYVKQFLKFVEHYYK